jgi:hypothetical protein
MLTILRVVEDRVKPAAAPRGQLGKGTAQRQKGLARYAVISGVFKRDVS